MLNTNTYKLEFQDMLRNQSTSNYMLKEANSKISDGYLIPESDVKIFNKAMEEDCLFRKYATKTAVNWAEGTIVAVCSTGEAKVTGEGMLYPTDSDDFKKITYDSYKIASLTKLLLRFVKDTKFDLDTYLMRDFARRFARAEEKILLTGTGIEEPLGLLNSADSISSAETGKISFDDVATLYFSLEPEYRKHAIWVMSDETAFSLRMEKDQSGYPLWQEDHDALLGKPVVTSLYIPATSSGTKPLLFGDLSYFWLLQRQELTIKPLFELFSNKGQVGYAAYERLDGKLIRKDAVRSLLVK